MIKIAICDDQKEIGAYLKEITQKHLVKSNIKVPYIISVFSKSKDVLKFLKNEKDVDLLFLDIEIDNMTGIDIAKEIRNNLDNQNLKIVYISAFKGYAMDLFKTRPLDFLIKPIQEKDMTEILNTVLKLVEDDKKVFSYKINSKIFVKNISEIIYFESEGRKVNIYTKDEKATFYGSLKGVFNELGEYNFGYTHNAYVVNYNYIGRVNAKDIEMVNGKTIPLSRANKSKILSLYMKD